MSDRVRVVVADDHPAARIAVRLALAGNGFDVCAEAGDAAGAVAAALRERPDVCLLDVNMPGGGIAAATEITRLLPDTAVVMLTVDRDDDTLFDALRAGAIGYLLKGMDTDRMRDALRGVLRGEAALPPALVSRVLTQFRSREGRRRLRLRGGRTVTLTEREREVVDLLRRGLTTAEMAASLELSQATVRRHVSAVLGKCEAPNRRAALDLMEAD